MRLVTYDRHGVRRLGALANGAVIDLPAAVGHPAFPPTLEHLVERHGGTMLDAARTALAAADVADLFAVPDPRLLSPLAGLAPRLLGPADVLAPPPGPGVIACRPQLACVVGRAGRRSGGAPAPFGYLLLATWSFRPDANGAGRAVEKPVATSAGPFVVTPEDLDPATAVLTVTVDGGAPAVRDVRAAVEGLVRRVQDLAHGESVAPGDVVTAPLTRYPAAAVRTGPLAPASEVELEFPPVGRVRASIPAPA